MPQHDFVSSSKKETSHCEELTGPDMVRPPVRVRPSACSDIQAGVDLTLLPLLLLLRPILGSYILADEALANNSPSPRAISEVKL